MEPASRLFLKGIAVFEGISIALLSNLPFYLSSFLLDSRLLVLAAFDPGAGIIFELHFRSVKSSANVLSLLFLSFSQTNYLLRVTIVILLTKIFETLFVLFRHSLPHAFHENQDLLDGPQWMLLLNDFSLLSNIQQQISGYTYLLTEEEEGRNGPLR